MDKSQILSAFNNHFEEFVTDVQRVFPNNKDIATVAGLISTVRKANPRIIIKAFQEHFIGKYRSHIESGDINFFIDNDYKSDVASLGASSSVLDKIDCLREPVRNMSKADQDNVVKYMQNLTKLADMYM